MTEANRPIPIVPAGVPVERVLLTIDLTPATEKILLLAAAQLDPEVSGFRAQPQALQVKDRPHPELEESLPVPMIFDLQRILAIIAKNHAF